MAGVLGRAFVQVFADLSKFTPGLKENIKKALDEQTKDLKFEELDKSAEKAGESAADELAQGVDSKIENNMEKEGKKGGLSLGRGFSAALSGAMSAFLPALIGLGVESAAALVPAATALAATIPAAIGTAVGALAVLKMATNGVSAALKTAFDPTKAKQFDAAMQKLAPAAQSFVKEIQKLHPALQQVQKDVQQTFFVQLQGVLTKVTSQLLPTLRSGLHQLSADLGQMGRNLLMAFGNGKEDLASIFIAAHNAIQPFIPLVGQLVGAFLAMAAAAGPLFAQLSGGFAGLLGKLVAFINAEASSGGMAKFFDDALVVLKQVGSLLGNVLGLVGDIVAALQTTGTQGLGMISRLVQELNVFFKSAAGKQTLVAVFTLLNQALTSLFQIVTPLLPVLGQLVTIFANGLTAALVKITPFLVGVADWLAKNPGLVKAAVAAWMVYRAALIAVSVAEAIMDALDPLTWIVLAVAAIVAGAYLIYKNWGALVAFFKQVGDAIANFFEGIWHWIVSVGKDIGTWFTVTLPRFFETLPARIMGALAQLGTMLVGLFLGALHDAGEAIGIGVGVILAHFITLPSETWEAIKDIGHLFVDLWHLAFSTGKAILISEMNAVIYLFTVFPGKVYTFVNRLPGIIGGAFRSAWEAAKTYVRNGADAVVSFVRALPGRISGFMRNVGGDILGGLRAGIDSVISGFNSGIDRVGGFLHIGLPHLPYLASGGLVNAPTLAMVGEAGPEAVIPMSDPARAAAVAKKTGLLDMLGSLAGNHGGATSIRVYLGTREITDILDVRIDKKMSDQANELSYGTR
jgi:hypothetical protein